MASTINASSTGSGGLISTGDSSGTLELQANGTTKLSVASTGVSITGGIASPLEVTGNSTAGAEIRLPEDTDNGSNYVALKAADSIASNVTFTLPSADGTSGQVLQTNGSGTLSFATPSSGAMTLISTQTANNSASIEWTGLSTYRSYLLVISNFVPSVADTLRVIVGTGSGPTYIESSYYYASVFNSSSSATPDGDTGGGTTRIDLSKGTSVVATAASSGLSGTVYLINMLSSPSADVRFSYQTVFPSSNTVFTNVSGTGTLYSNTAAKTAVKVFFTSNNISTGSASLYGLQSS